MVDLLVGQTHVVADERFEALFAHTLHCVHEIDEIGRICAMNDAGLELLGVGSLKAVLGTHQLELVAEADRERVREAMDSAYRGEVADCEFVTLSGQLLASSFVPVRDIGGTTTHLLGLTQDITRQRHDARALTVSESRTALILQSAGEGIYGLDAQGNVTFGNTAAEKILGWHTPDVIGRRSHDVHHHSHADGSDYPRQECPIYAALKDGEVHQVENEVFWHADGSAVPVEYTSTPIINDGKPDGAVVVFRDISARKSLEQQRAAAFEEIRLLKTQLEQERDYLRDEINLTTNFGEIIGESAALRRTLAQIEAVASTPANVIVLGESGVGKEMVARALHLQSDRADKPLVKVNCASIPRELFESEFFGHVKGAFTGAHRDRVGRVQLAHGGTLFLDEVGEIPLSEQGKLLRVLQEREFEKVGDDQTVSVDVRVVAATNRDLLNEVKAGRFREDLYYRISVFPIEVPPLRDRSDDIAPLALHFLKTICRELGRGQLRITQQQLQVLKRHSWPGNVRELKNVIERAVISSPGNRLRLDLALNANEQALQHTPAPLPEGTSFVTDAEFRAMEKSNIIAALRQTNWRIWGAEGAAELLGINPSTLTYRMKRLQIVRVRD